MSEEALKKLEEQLNCSICLDTYTYPKLLQCFHVYCQKCLVPLVRDQQGKLGLTCPTCRQVTPIPADRGVAGLQPAFHINRLLEIQESFKKTETPPSATPEKAVESTTASASLKGALGHCFQHPEEKLKLYCETCGKPICYECIMKGAEHHDHDYEKLNPAFLKYKEEITSYLDPMEKQVVAIEEALAQLDTRCGEIAQQREATEDSIHVTFRRLREVLNVRETELIDKLHRMTQEKLKGLAAQRDQIETILAQLNSCLLFMRESLKPGYEGDALMVKANTVKQVKELTTPFQPDTLEPSTEASLIFSAPVTDLISQNYGQVSTDLMPNPSKCHATGKGVRIAAVGEKSTAILQAISFVGKPCEEPIKSLKCELVSEITDARASCSVERRGKSQYEISYQPTIKGRHQLHIKVEGQHIMESPFSIVVKSPVEKLGTPIQTYTRVNGPYGVAITQRGEMVVTEMEKHCVSMFTLSGQKLLSLGTHDSGQEQFSIPCGVALDGEGNILVTDFDTCCLQKFTPSGQFLSAVGTKGSGPLQFGMPFGIAVNPINDKVYVVESSNHRVQILNPCLTFSSMFGNHGSGKGQFINPSGIACNSAGMIYVADSENHRIQVFTAEGEFLRMFGSRGQGRGELNMPCGVAIDSNNLVFVSEGNNHRVSVFSSEGQFVVSFGRKGHGPGELEPCGLAVDETGVVYVCDTENNLVAF